MKKKIFLVMIIGLAFGFSGCATSRNLPRPMIINNGPPPNAVQKDVPANADPTTPKPFKIEMLDEKPTGRLPSTAPANPSQTVSLAARVTNLEKQVKTNTQVIGATHKVVFKNQEKLKWLEAYQRKMDAKLAGITWDAGQSNLAPIRLGNFRTGSAKIDSYLAAQVKSTVKKLKQISVEAAKSGKSLSAQVLGYASPSGNTKTNAALSLKRAEAVAEILKKGGMAITAVKGMGEISRGLYGNTNQCVRILPEVK